MAAATLIIVCGLPGSGKTTHALQLQLQLPGVRFCPDEWMKALELNLYDEASRAKIEALQWELMRQLLPLGVNVIVEWGTWARSERDALRTGARSLGARIELHYLSAPVELLFDRVRRRALEDPPLTREQLLQWTELFQVPTSDEMRLFDEAKTIACC